MRPVHLVLKDLVNTKFVAESTDHPMDAKDGIVSIAELLWPMLFKCLKCAPTAEKNCTQGHTTAVKKVLPKVWTACTSFGCEAT